jgi:hypothetical protein
MEGGLPTMRGVVPYSTAYRSRDRTLAKTVWAPSPEASPLVADVPEP